MNTVFNPTLIITGASKGIGQYLFNEFLKSGNRVIGIYNTTNPKQNSELYYRVDITLKEEVLDFVTHIQSNLHNIVLINAAGINYNAFAHKANLEEWTRVIDTNLLGLFNLTGLILPIMRSAGFGRVINFASIVAQAGVVGTSAYAASKSALWGLSRALAVENAEKGITVNNINLGYFDIGMMEQIPALSREAIIQKIPAKRLGFPVEILGTVRYIIENGYLNGTSIDLNGGLF